MTAAEYMEKKLAEKSKDFVKNRESATDEQKSVIKDFYETVASGDKQKAKEFNDHAVEKGLVEKAQAVGTVGTGTTGGVLVPTIIRQDIIKRLFYVSPMRNIATVIDNCPADFTLPSENALPTTYWVAEGAAITESASTMDPNKLVPQKHAGLDSFTREVIADAATNPSIQKFVEDRFVLALALQENEAFVNGDGAGKPFGFRSSAITPGSVSQAGATLAYTDTTKLKYSLGTAYRKQAVYVTSSNGVLALENLRDTQGRPIFREGLAEDAPATLLGRPLYVVDEIPSNLGAGTNATEIWYGYFKNYFIGDRDDMAIDWGHQANDFRDDKMSMRLVKRVGGRPILGESFKKLTGVIAS